jgi:hypothetical protein
MLECPELNAVVRAIINVLKRMSGSDGYEIIPLIPGRAGMRVPDPESDNPAVIQIYPGERRVF